MQSCVGLMRLRKYPYFPRVCSFSSLHEQYLPLWKGFLDPFAACHVSNKKVSKCDLHYMTWYMYKGIEWNDGERNTYYLLTLRVFFQA